MTAHRVWLITGCSVGFGRAIAEAAIDRGDRVVATARRTETLRDLTGERVLTLQLDVTDPKQIGAAVRAAIDRFGRIDVLVNNAGHGSVGAVEEIDLDDLRRLHDVMFFGAVALTQAVLPHMRAQGAGNIVQISSVGGQSSPPGFGAYCSAKFALEAISESLHLEAAPLGIRILIVEPGAFRTEFGGSRMHRSAPLDAYAATVGPTRGVVDAMDGSQPGDPRKAAATILQVLDAEERPLRLALGDDAVDALRAHQRWLAEDLDGWESTSRATTAAT